jgi:hypothetical protein
LAGIRTPQRKAHSAAEEVLDSGQNNFAMDVFFYLVNLYLVGIIGHSTWSQGNESVVLVYCLCIDQIRAVFNQQTGDKGYHCNNCCNLDYVVQYGARYSGAGVGPVAQLA